MSKVKKAWQHVKHSADFFWKQKHKWWKKPSLRNDSGKGRTATTLELFYDLIFAIALEAIAIFVTENRATGSVGFSSLDFFLTFQVIIFASILWTSWIKTTFYSDLFESFDLSHRGIIFVNMITIAFISFGMLVIHDDPVAANRIIFISAMLNRFFIVLIFARASIYSYSFSYQRYTILYTVIPFLISGILYGLLLIFPQSLSYAASSSAGRTFFFTVAYLAVAIEVLSLGLSFFSKYKNHIPKFSSDHLNERFSLFMMLTWGTILITLIIEFGQEFERSAGTSIVPFLIAIPIVFYLVFIIYLQYNDQINNTRTRVTPLKRTIFVLLHLPIIIGVVYARIAIADILALQLENSGPLEIDIFNEIYLFIGLTLIFSAIHVVYLSDKKTICVQTGYILSTKEYVTVALSSALLPVFFACAIFIPVNDIETIIAVIAIFTLYLIRNTIIVSKSLSLSAYEYE